MQASCFSDWLGMQQAPLAAWRASITSRETPTLAAEAMATKPKSRVVVENCILTDICMWVIVKNVLYNLMSTESKPHSGKE